MFVFTLLFTNFDFPSRWQNTHSQNMHLDGVVYTKPLLNLCHFNSVIAISDMGDDINFALWQHDRES